MILDSRATESEIYEHARSLPATVKGMLAGWSNDAPNIKALKLNILAESMQAKPVADHVEIDGRIARMCSAQWWANNLRSQLLKNNEKQEFEQGQIKKHKQCYVSDFAMRRVTAREARNREILEGLAAVSSDGQGVGLLDCVDASVSNPKHRRTELMTRCKGFEDVAKVMGHAAVFMTITCPSRFHRFNRNGNDNKNWDGSTPKQAQAYLCAMWAKIRAEWKRRDIVPYGFRVAEPHHDGCPHWHILLFVPADLVGWFNVERYLADGKDHGAGLIGVAGEYSHQDSKGEIGAAKARFEAKIIEGQSVRDANTGQLIEGSGGSATGYIAKYISKNLDGHDAQGERWGLDHDSGMYTDTASRRVRTWASVHGIRQFQQIGGPSVTVWRQLRGYKGEFHPQMELFHDCKVVAEEGKWAAFWMLQGGYDVPRSELISPMYEPGAVGRYGDRTVRTIGIRHIYELVTKITSWEIVPAGCADWYGTVSRRAQAEAATPGSTAMRKMIEAVERSKISSEGEAVAPWTRVNNCTGEFSGAGVNDKEEHHETHGKHRSGHSTHEGQRKLHVLSG